MLNSSPIQCAGNKQKWGLPGSAFLFLLFALSINTYPFDSFAQKYESVETVNKSKQTANKLSLQGKTISRLDLLKISHKRSPDDQAIAAQLATTYIQMARRESNPEYYRLANQILEPWVISQNIPGLRKKPITDELRLVRATLSQHIHHYKEASEDLLYIIKKQPKNAQAWLTLSTIQLVQGDYAKAQVSCSALYKVSTIWLSNLCYSQLYSLTGSAERAYGMQQSLLAQLKGQQPELALWVSGLLAETAMRMGKNEQAEKYFQDGLKIKADDTYVLRTYSNFLLEQNRPNEVIKLLEPQLKNHPDNDQLLLRLALAVKMKGNSKKQAELVDTLELRYKNALALHGHIHGRDEALFLMEFKSKDKDNLNKALQLALDNWQTQKEPDDALILLQAAIATNQPEKAQIVLNWMNQHKLEDVRLIKLRKPL